MLRTTRSTVAAAAAGVLLATLAGCGGTDRDTDHDPHHNTADVTFAQQMVPHHEQALEMVAMTTGHALDPAVTDVVDRIEKAQSPEITEMRGWLKDWDEKVPSGSGMTMTGMMSDEQMSRLTDTADPAFQTLWLQLMVSHHEGALTMAKTEIATGRAPDALALATSILASQTKEIATMKALAPAG